MEAHLDRRLNPPGGRAYVVLQGIKRVGTPSKTQETRIHLKTVASHKTETEDLPNA